MPMKKEDYPPEWPEISKYIRYVRAQNQCEWIDPESKERCTRKNGEPIPGNPRGSLTVLTVMHLDHDTRNNDFSNLLSACQLHHLRYDLKHHIKNAKATRVKRKIATKEAAGQETLF